MADSGQKKKVAMIGVSSLLLVAMVVAVTVGVVKHTGSKNSGQQGSGEVAASSKAIDSLCQTTDYKKECVESLQTAGNSTDPKALIQAGFSAAMKYIADAANKSVTLQELEKDPRSAQALSICKDLMDYAIDDLQRSFEQLGRYQQVVSQAEEFLIDLRIWLSATITYQESCLDAFENTTTDAGEKMKSALNTSMKLSSNALSMATEIPNFLKDLQIPGFNRRLFSDEEAPVMGHGEVPEWVGPEVRRLLAAPIPDTKPNVVVAQDGSGQFKSINDALKQVPKKNTQPFVIYVKQGIYNEKVLVDKTMTHVMMIGDGSKKTRVTGRLSFAQGVPTVATASFAALGDYFMARDMGFENTAGPEGHQAVALRVQSDKSIFYRCDMDGHQDTLYVHTNRQFYRDCSISGTIDFVFGDSATVFQNCQFLVRRPMANQQCLVTAQGRKERKQASAIIIHGSRITAAPDYLPVKSQFRSYLGRPWKEYSRTIIMETFIDDIIQPDGWFPWEGNFALDTLFYAEFNNNGPGADKSRRVKWRGIRELPPQHILQYTAGRFLLGGTWIPATGVPYTAGLLNGAKIA